MFRILQGLRFYSSGSIREKLSEANGIVQRGLTRYVERGKLKRSDILVSYLDRPSKSGAHLARLYADETRIYANNVVEKGELVSRLAQSPEVQLVLFVDDLVGTGESAVSYLAELDSMLAPALEQGRVKKVVFLAVAAFIGGHKRVELAVEQLRIPVEYHACDVLDETAQCFGTHSSFFSDPHDREYAKGIALVRVKELEKGCPLGYGALELAVVFEHRCPNNSLPILWSESSKPRWVPLFKRL